VLASAQLLVQGDEVDRLSVVEEPQHRLVDRAVRVRVEVGRPEDLDEARQRLAAFEEHGPPSQLLSDNGAEFVGKWGSTAESELSAFLRENAVTHVRAASHHPTTLGKQERLWQTLERELLLVTWLRDEDDARERLAAWREYYNTERPNLALDGKTPAEVFFGIRRPRAGTPARKKAEAPRALELEAVIGGRRLRLVAKDAVLDATLDGAAIGTKDPA